MSFAFARAQRYAYLLLRMEAEESGQRLELGDIAIYIRGEVELQPEHRHGDACACHLRGE